ncbi:hypothetical protein QN399_01030 [Pseudomonas sp. 10C3]|uniref:hypothetical protein n=1 Tax=Pseudomonas sp. 10C3 TaxID=3118753 RepID=UPI002E81A17A|nr:hypothetical protein [Pseudomonas sp. 10C3]MEE3504859.1 hypothetical protein [Pseudomonas sp. 10C3]
MSDLKSLKELAEAAVEQSDNIGEAAWYTADCLQHLLSAGAPDADFIAAANPAVVLGLIAENEILREALELSKGTRETEGRNHELRAQIIEKMEEQIGLLTAQKSYEDGIACAFDSLMFAAANTSDEYRSDLLEEMAEDIIENAPAYKKQWKDITGTSAENRQLKAECEGLRAALTSSSEFLMHDAKVRGMLDGAGRISPMFPLRRLVMEQIDVALSKGERS